MAIFRSLLIFILAGFCEIGGGFLIWKNIKEDKPVWWSIAGAVILILYGFVSTLQDAGFGRVYATYGAIFIIMSIGWAMKFDNFKPDFRDIAGAAVVLVGALIMIWPRK